MKQIVVAVIMPILLMAFNYDGRKLETVYFNSLIFLKQADGPQQVKMISTGGASGQTTSCRDGVLFTYKSRGARSVRIAGSFNGWKPVRMERSTSGIWYHFTPATGSSRSITYKYLVDGIWTPDPLNEERMDDRMGSYLSVTEPAVKVEGSQVTWRKIAKNEIEFRIFRPGASLVSLVGDFNNWNPEDDLLTRGADNIWRLRKKLYPGIFRYEFVVDGEWVPDTFNGRSGSDSTGALCSIIEINK
jgi:1,4-alpha-glucan branching enzyme